MKAKSVRETALFAKVKSVECLCHIPIQEKQQGLGISDWHV